MKKTDLNTDQEVILTLNVSIFWGLLKANIYIFLWSNVFFYCYCNNNTSYSQRHELLSGFSIKTSTSSAYNDRWCRANISFFIPFPDKTYLTTVLPSLSLLQNPPSVGKIKPKHPIFGFNKSSSSAAKPLFFSGNGGNSVYLLSLESSL